MVSMVSGSAFAWCLCHGSLVSTVPMVSMVSGSAFGVCLMVPWCIQCPWCLWCLVVPLVCVSWFPGVYSAHGVYDVW